MAKIFPTNSVPVTLTLYRNIPFDNSYKHHSFIYNGFMYNGQYLNEDAKQEDFLNIRFKRLASQGSTHYRYTRVTKTGDFNFDYGNGLTTSLTLELSGDETLSNYLKVSYTYEGNTEDIFYFITSITQVNSVTYRLALELDVIMTFGNELVGGLSGIPVFTRKKHCFRCNSNGWIGSTDFQHIDSDFVNVKANIVESKKVFLPKIAHASDDVNNTLRDIKWVYIAYSGEDNPTSYTGINNYEHIKTIYGFRVLCLPLVPHFVVKGHVTNQPEWSIDIDVYESLRKLIGNGAYKGAKISPYPPFNDVYSNDALFNNISISFTRNTNDEITHMTFDTGVGNHSAYTVTASGGTGNYWGKGFCMGNNLFTVIGKGDVTPNKDWSLSGFITINEENDDIYSYGKPSVIEYTAQTPSIDNTIKEYKLLFPPFRKYTLKTIYDRGLELYPQIYYSDVFSTGESSKQWDFKTITTCYPFDYTYYTFTPTMNRFNAFNNYGLSGVNNHSMPVGENALDYFNTTQANQYYQGKTAQAVTNALTILGSSALLGVGAYMGNPKLVVGGAMGIASGVKGEIDVYSSINAKQEDLMNTPDTFTTGGSTFAHDLAMSEYDEGSGDVDMFPYLLTNVCGASLEKTAMEIYYNFGYEVNRCCYFNDELTTTIYSTTKVGVDEHIFTRTLFNYVRIEDDITNKIRSASVPLIVKQKLNTILNNGITLWTFFGFQSVWGDMVEIDSGSGATTYNVNHYLFKEEKDNAEYYGAIYNS